MFWRSVWLLAINDLRLTLKDRTSLLWMLLLPLALMWFFGQAGGGPSGPPKISLSVDNRDGDWVAEALLTQLEVDQLDLQLVGEDPEAQHIRTLVLPADLTETLLAGESQTLRLELDPDASASFGRGAEVHIFRALVRLQGSLLELDILAPEDAPSEELALGYKRLQELPPKVMLEVSNAGEGTPVPQGFAQSVPGMLTMIVLMMTLIYGGVFLILEKQQGMLRRQATLPATRFAIVLGKIVGRLFIAAMQIVLLLTAARLLFRFELGSSWTGLLLLCASYSVAVAGLSVLLGAVLKTPEQASTVGWLASMGLAGLGGCWWPSEVMPEWLQMVAKALPTSWAMDGFHSLISYGRGAAAVLTPSMVLLVFGLGSAALAVRYLRWD